MRWVITADRVNTETDASSPFYAKPRLGVNGESATMRLTLKTQAGINALAADLTHEFKLFDDDGELHYEGWCDDPSGFDEEQAFHPLAFGEYDTGCTTMKFRKLNVGKWETL